MRAVLVEVEFPEAVFTSHYTKGFRETYLIPLPTSVAGMFGAMLGIERHNMPSFIRNKWFGAKLLSYNGVGREIFVFPKIKDKAKDESGNYRWKVEWAPAFQGIVNNPRYLIAMASEDEGLLRDVLRSLGKGLVYLPYGGLNDFIALDVKVHGDLYEVELTREVEGYAPEEDVETVIPMEGGEMYKSYVKYRGDVATFIMVYRARIRLKREIYAVKDYGVPLYEIGKNFNYLVMGR